MNRVCLTKDGKLIEMQGGGDDLPGLMEMRLNTLKQNALNAGYTEDQIEVKWVTDEEWAAIQEANKPPVTYADLRRAEYPLIADQLDAIWKGEPFVSDMRQTVLAVKTKYPKEA